MNNRFNETRPLEDGAPSGTEVERELEMIQPALRAYVGSLLGSVAEVHDVVQETNLLIWERREEYEPGSHFKAYAFQVARWKVMSCRRDRARERKRTFNEELLFELADEAEDFYQRGMDPRRGALADCLRSLPEERRTLLTRHYVDGVSLTDLALESGRKPSALHKTISRIRQSLRQCINERLHRSTGDDQ